MHTTTSLSSHFTWPLNCKLSVDSFLFKIAFLHLKINKRNKISPTLLPRRNFHFTSYLWGRKHRKFLAENFPSNMAYQFSLGLSLTPQRDDGHVRVKERNYAPIGQFPINQKYLSVSRLGQIEKVQYGGLPSSITEESCYEFIVWFWT